MLFFICKRQSQAVSAFPPTPGSSWGFIPPVQARRLQGLQTHSPSTLLLLGRQPWAEWVLAGTLPPLAHLRSSAEQRLGPRCPSPTAWDAGVPSFSVQGYGVATVLWLDLDPLLIRTTRRQGHCHGLVARWESGGGPAGPCLEAPACCPGCAGASFPLSKTSHVQ